MELTELTLKKNKGKGILDGYEALFVRKCLQTATFCGQQGHISRTVRAILSGQFVEQQGGGTPGPANQYGLLSQKAMPSQSIQ